jgi:hypothetical protein
VGEGDGTDGGGFAWAGHDGARAKEDAGSFVAQLTLVLIGFGVCDALLAMYRHDNNLRVITGSGCWPLTRLVFSVSPKFDVVVSTSKFVS